MNVRARRLAREVLVSAIREGSAMLDEEFPLGKRGLEGVDPRTLAACMEAAAACGLACDACADACLADRDVVELRNAIRAALQCADIGLCTSRLLARSTDISPRLLRAQVLACARACAACAEACQRHEHQHTHCRLCARACRLAAERCGALLRELPDTFGRTHVRGGEGELDERTEIVWRELSGQAH